MRKLLAILYLICSACSYVRAQEYAGPLRYNPQLFNNHKTHKGNTAKKTTTTLTLPFFEDFTQYSIFPDSNKWVDYEVYINNTMCASPVSWGVATFDDLDYNGIPYDSFSNSDFRYADSLTSQPIDMSTSSPGDSVYLSFFYQPQGTGFYPLAQDSLILYIKTRFGGYVKIWSTPGASLQPFKQVMIPITDSLYFYNSFQFRFVNIAALYWADAVWNVDYIRLDKNRSAGDTIVNDVAFTSSPTFLLNDYSSMPYSQYRPNAVSETVIQVSDSLRNCSSVGQTVNYDYSVQDLTGGMSLFTSGVVPYPLSAYQTRQTPEALSMPTLPTYPANTKVDFQSKFYIESTPTTGPTNNDTITRDQVFDNYLAYDDGTAEKSYYLNQFPTLPGMIAIEYHLNVPDTLRGLAIYFGRQTPFANYKTFSINIYSALRGINGAPADAILYASDLLTPEYADTTNHFWYYTLDTPIVMPAGTFYAGTEQCAGCGSDSLYLGLDANRIGSNHAYYNVVGTWNPSLISGAIMIRPLLGKYVQGTGVADIPVKKDTWRLSPNPVKDNLKIEFDGREEATYSITDIMGHTLMTGTIINGKIIDLSQLAPGMYFVGLTTNHIPGEKKKIIKL